jgi:hypothetical protein
MPAAYASRKVRKRKREGVIRGSRGGESHDIELTA